MEAQQADRDTPASTAPPPSAQEAARLTRRRTLELARARAEADLAAARNTAHRAMLEAAIQALDAQLREWTPG